MIRNFEDFLGVKDRLLYIGSIIETMLINSVKALVERKEVFLNSVEVQREEAEKVRKELDEKCIVLIATHQPAANGLRFLTSAMKIAGELEKTSRQVRNLSLSSGKILSSFVQFHISDIAELADTAKAMLRDCLDAFVRKDEQLALSVLHRGVRAGKIKEKILKELPAIMETEKKNYAQCAELLLIACYLEMIAWNAVNVAEDVLFMLNISKTVSPNPESSPVVFSFNN